VTKAEIIARIYEKVSFSQNQATDVVEAAFDVIKGCLEKGKTLKFLVLATSLFGARIPAEEEIQRPARRLSSRAAGYLPSRQARF